MTDDGLAITVAWDGPDEAILSLVGEIDLATQGHLSASLGEVIGRGASRVVVDLDGVTFIDSSGLAALIDGVAQGASIVVRRLQDRVRRVFDIVVIDGLTVER